MIPSRAAFAFLLAATPVAAITPEGREFVQILKQLEPVHCEKRKLRREIAIAEVEKRSADVKALRARFAQIDAEPRTAKLERRLAHLEPRINSASTGVPRDPEDLQAISEQHREAFYRCA
ncbi:MAG: hypothetical protein ACREVG_04430 [Burkholderiales bacterium]